jgi:hypothetical protein
MATASRRLEFRTPQEEKRCREGEEEGSVRSTKKICIPRDALPTEVKKAWDLAHALEHLSTRGLGDLIEVLSTKTEISPHIRPQMH